MLSYITVMVIKRRVRKFDEVCNNQRHFCGCLNFKNQFDDDIITVTCNRITVIKSKMVENSLIHNSTNNTHPVK